MGSDWFVSCVEWSWPWASRIAAAIRSPSVAELGEELASDPGFIPRTLTVGSDDRLFMALAREQDDVSRARSFERGRDRLAPVRGHEEIVPSPPTRRLGALGDLFEDRDWILPARVLLGHDDELGALSCDPAHLRPLGRVPFTRRPEHSDQATATRRGRRCQQVEDRL